MPRFLTISPTHVPGKKKYAWNNLLKDGFIALGWDHTDYTGMNIDRIVADIRLKHFDNESSAIDAFTKFLALSEGDLVAVNNVNHGIFGIGRIKTDYKFKWGIHNNGAADRDEFYSHYREVEWLVTSYRSATELLGEEDDAWAPYGTVGKLYDSPPNWVHRALGLASSLGQDSQVVEVRWSPSFLNAISQSLKYLQEDLDHRERGHESLVEELLVVLGYARHKDIKYQQGRLDITIHHEDKPLMVVEVKRAWDLSLHKDQGALKQAYGYAQLHGIRYVVITNGDYYALHDRLRGLSYEQNLLGEFKLSSLVEENRGTLDRLRKVNLVSINVKEIFQHLSVGF